MKLSKLISEIDVEEVIGNSDIEIKEVKIDSNSVCEGCLFIALKGKEFDGNSFINQAEKYGAIAVVTENRQNTDLTQIIVKDSRKAMAKIAKIFYGKPDEKLKIIGVVGTNGKTTTAHLIYQVLNNNSKKCGLIGTLGTFYNNVYIESDLTTPDPLVLYKLLRDMVNNGIEYVAMEVSAHAIALNKIDDINFEIGVFTNCTQDHLDFFENMEKYKAVKKKFFVDNRCKYKVVNVDDELGKEIVEEKEKVISYGIENPSDVFAIDIIEKQNYTQYVINLFDCIYEIKSSLIGRFNVYNAMGCATACALLGVKTNDIVNALINANLVSGRMERIDIPNMNIFVDYAHTPDGIKSTLSALKKICKGNLICVMGCGGNRDKEKRAVMGAICAELADFTIITSDNPRFEEPMDIISDIEVGVLEKTDKYLIVQDRAEAIKHALSFSKEDDVVLIAGKGSEKHQEVLGIKKLYNDKDTIIETYKKMRRKQN